jgi:phosphoglycerol transferase MdoB-like AlkP superfamily enzyme
MRQRVKLYFISLFALLTIIIVEKIGFALSHPGLRQQLDYPELMSVLAWGMRFDLAIAAFFTLIGYLVAQTLNILFRANISNILRHTTFVSATLLILLHGADSLYFDEAGRHLGYELAEGLNSGGALLTSALTTYRGMLIIQIVVIIAAYYWIRFLFRRFSAEPLHRLTITKQIAAEAMLLPLLLLSVVLIRGIEQIPMEPLYAYEIGDSKEATLALNGAYNAVFTQLAPTAVTPVFAKKPNSQEIAIVREMYNHGTPSSSTQPKKRNVFVFLLESWSAAYMASYGNDTISTPLFDKLRMEGLTTRAMMAGGDRTTEGMFVTFCSTQNPLGQTVAQSQLQEFEYNCLPEILKSNGWSSAFFQGSYSNTSGTGAFAMLLGFDNSFGREDMDPSRAKYPMNNWGYHDPDLYSFVLDKAKKLPRPFLVGINTTSTHDQELPPGVEPILPNTTFENRYKNTLHFADKALFDFVQTIRNDSELKDSLIVLVADHSGPTPHDPFRERLIPFAIIANGLEPRFINSVVSQRDIAPTVLELLNIPSPKDFTGHSLLQENHPQYADYYSKGTLGWVEGTQVVETLINKPDSISCYSLEHTLNTETRTTCGENEYIMKKRALAFTHLSQSLLFEGKLKRFAEIH